MEFWPFLIAANQHWDYRVLLCPDFINRAGRKDFFRKQLDPSPTADGKVRSQDVMDAKFGRISLFYRTTPVRRDGLEAYDKSGRLLVRHEGIVVRQFGSSPRLGDAEARRLIEHASTRIDEVFDAAWPVTSPPAPTPSHSQTIGRVSQPPVPAQPPIAETMARTRSFERFLLVGVLSASLLANAALAWVYYRAITRIATMEVELDVRTRRLDELNKEIAELKQRIDQQSDPFGR